MGLQKRMHMIPIKNAVERRASMDVNKSEILQQAFL
jgi:hypothetical protein